MPPLFLATGILKILCLVVGRGVNCQMAGRWLRQLFCEIIWWLWCERATKELHCSCVATLAQEAQQDAWCSAPASTSHQRAVTVTWCSFYFRLSTNCSTISMQTDASRKQCFWFDKNIWNKPPRQVSELSYNHRLFILNDVNVTHRVARYANDVMSTIIAHNDSY